MLPRKWTNDAIAAIAADNDDGHVEAAWESRLPKQDGLCTQEKL